ncbi:MAG: sugar phosphate isomerase/epimerase [Treponema sp.]|nr:sugar phosphate isomerase/epimerase [Treponema sp.]
MNTGIFYWFGYRIPSKERFKLIADTGFKNTVLWWGDQFIDTDGPKEELPDLAREAGLFVENMHTDFDHCNSLWADNQHGEEILARYLNSAKDCKTYGIPAMVVHLSSGDEPPPPNKIGLERLKQITGEAEKGNIIVALENLRKTEYLDFAFANIDSPNLKLCYDSGHENCFTKKGDVLDKFGGKLYCLHLHDNDGSGDQHTIPGNGSIEWQTVIGKIKHSGFGGSVTLEAYNDFPQKYKNAGADTFLADAYRAARSIADKLEK